MCNCRYVGDSCIGFSYRYSKIPVLRQFLVAVLSTMLQKVYVDTKSETVCRTMHSVGSY